ncbi:MAG: hypothetical protein U1E89_04685 [Burkholderiaceae bacterium]
MANSHQSAGDGIVSDSTMQAGFPSCREGSTGAAVDRPAGWPPREAVASARPPLDDGPRPLFFAVDALSRTTCCVARIQALVDVASAAVAAQEEGSRQLNENSLTLVFYQLHELASDLVDIAAGAAERGAQ